jgi:hypothetical protein
MTRREAIAKTIDRSSLGAPAVKKLRARTSIDDRTRVLRKASARTPRDSEDGATKSEHE